MPNLATKHEQYPDGFPARLNDDLLGHWVTPKGTVVVEDHPHGYEVFFYPCLDCSHCNLGVFRSCESRGHIFTVAGGKEGHRAVLEYLEREGSPVHIEAFRKMKQDDSDRELERLEREREENEKLAVEEESYKPSREERLAAIEAELTALRSEL